MTLWPVEFVGPFKKHTFKPLLALVQYHLSFEIYFLFLFLKYDSVCFGNHLQPIAAVLSMVQEPLLKVRRWQEQQRHFMHTCMYLNSYTFWEKKCFAVWHPSAL
jgi:hypothetical protein